MTLDEALDELYGAAPGRFTQERARLAKLLKDDERRDDAAALAKTRKPVLAAWALNQLPRRRGSRSTSCSTPQPPAGRPEGRARGRGRDVFERAAARSRRSPGCWGGRELLRRGAPSTAIVDQVRDSLRAAAIGAEGRDCSPGDGYGPIRLEGFGLVSELAPPSAAARAVSPGRRRARPRRDTPRPSGAREAPGFARPRRRRRRRAGRGRAEREGGGGTSRGRCGRHDRRGGRRCGRRGRAPRAAASAGARPRVRHAV
jgi:hypothetical protein